MYLLSQQANEAIGLIMVINNGEQKNLVKFELLDPYAVRTKARADVRGCWQIGESTRTTEYEKGSPARIIWNISGRVELEVVGPTKAAPFHMPAFLVFSSLCHPPASSVLKPEFFFLFWCNLES